jgi:hypothetical protein
MGSKFPQAGRLAVFMRITRNTSDFSNIQAKHLVPNVRTHPGYFRPHHFFLFQQIPVFTENRQKLYFTSALLLSVLFSPFDN